MRSWLPKVIQVAKPFMSDVDAEKGSRWFTGAGECEGRNLFFDSREPQHPRGCCLRRVLCPRPSMTGRVCARTYSVGSGLKMSRGTRDVPSDSLRQRSNPQAGPCGKLCAERNGSKGEPERPLRCDVEETGDDTSKSAATGRNCSNKASNRGNGGRDTRNRSGRT